MRLSPSRPHRINPILAKKVDATLNQNLAAGLILNSTSPYLSPLVVVPKPSGGLWITVNYKKLNDILRVHQVLDSFGKGRVFSLFDLLWSFRQITAQKDTNALTAFCPPTEVCEWLVVPQGSSASPSWGVKVIHKATIGLELAASPVLVFPDWDDMEDGSRASWVHCDASVDVFRATLDQEQPDGSMRPIAYVSGATLDSERHRMPLDLEASSIV